mmetsp:Transcript_5303/g.15688  ORF Transcript_5303/g.15688 Transcript_5303/m.15688 type:complete len:222 (-) Transcript_5303:708-1373(-)
MDRTPPPGEQPDHVRLCRVLARHALPAGLGKEAVQPCAPVPRLEGRPQRVLQRPRRPAVDLLGSPAHARLRHGPSAVHHRRGVVRDLVGPWALRAGVVLGGAVAGPALLLCAPPPAHQVPLQVCALPPPPEHRRRALRGPLHAPRRAPVLLCLRRSRPVFEGLALCAHVDGHAPPPLACGLALRLRGQLPERPVPLRAPPLLRVQLRDRRRPLRPLVRHLP